jgi:hypothetical protein
MSITKKTINNNEYTFINHSRSNRSGFVHETELYKNDVLIGEYKIQYYNRTWECYQFQSVMRSAINTLLSEEFEAFKDAYKRQHNIKRLTKAKNESMMQDFVENKPTLYADLQVLYTTL